MVDVADVFDSIIITTVFFVVFFSCSSSCSNTRTRSHYLFGFIVCVYFERIVYHCYCIFVCPFRRSCCCCYNIFFCLVYCLLFFPEISFFFFSLNIMSACLRLPLFLIHSCKRLSLSFSFSFDIFFYCSSSYSRFIYFYVNYIKHCYRCYAMVLCRLNLLMFAAE